MSFLIIDELAVTHIHGVRAGVYAPPISAPSFVRDCVSLLRQTQGQQRHMPAAKLDTSALANADFDGGKRSLFAKTKRRTIDCTDAIEARAPSSRIFSAEYLIPPIVNCDRNCIMMPFSHQFCERRGVLTIRGVFSF